MQKLVSACLTAKCMSGRESVRERQSQRGRGGSVREFVTNLNPCQKAAKGNYNTHTATKLFHTNTHFGSKAN